VEHACEAIVALELQEAAPAVAAARSLPDPEAAFRVDLPGNMGGYFRREMVRVNHAKNCVMCHAVSEDRSEPLSATVPSESQPLPPPNSTAYYEAAGSRVLASVTYLKQDFSLMQSVANPGNWPKKQRFDFFVSVRRELATNPPKASANAARYQRAYEHALKHLGVEDVRAEANPEPDLPAVAKFVSLTLNPDGYLNLPGNLLDTAPAAWPAVFNDFQKRYGLKGARVLLATAIAEQGQSSLANERAARLLAVLRSDTPDGLISEKLTAAAK
jgi:hypothetical protein